MRLTDPRPARESVSIRFDGQPIAAHRGETVAAALSAAEIVSFRRMPSGAPRGLWCGMGACFDCLVTIDGRAGQRACLAKVADGMEVSSTPASPFAPDAAPAQEERACDVLVVGAGSAGLAAAVAAAEAGAAVLVLDERDAPGGQYYKPAARPDRQHRRGEALRARVRAAGATVLSGAVAWGAFAPNQVAAVAGGRSLVLRPRRLVLATGAHEAPVPIPGWTLPGVMTTGAMQGLVRTHRVLPGRRVVVAGNGPLNLQLACELLDGGAEIAAVVEAAAPPGLRAWRDATRLAAASPDLAATGLRQVLRLRRAGVPVLWQAWPLGCEGDGRFAALRVATPAGERRISADLCALHWGFQPETGLARALGVAHRPGPAGLETVTGPDGRTSLASVFAVGDGASPGGARVALARGRLAGLAAARDLGLSVGMPYAARRALARAERFQGALWRLFQAPALDVRAVPDGTVLCRCEEVQAGTLRAALAEGAASVPALKRATRAGMGRCGGRMCGAAVARLCGAAGGSEGPIARVPVRPVPAAALMRDWPEPQPPVLDLPAPIRRTARTGPAPESCDVPSSCDVLVIGGGVVGLSAALFLARDGRDVVLVDRGEPGLGASTANAGSLHVQLLPYAFRDGDPGPLAKALAMGPPSIALWRALARDAGETLGLRTEGGLILAETEADLALLRRKAAFERERGVDTALIGPNELASLAPALDRRFVGAAFCPQEGQIDPLRGTMALLSLARRAGVRVVPGVTVAGLARDGAAWRVDTGAGPVRAGQVLNAAGPHAPGVAALTGVTLAVRAAVQQVVVTEAVPPLLRPLVAQAGRHLSLKQGEGGHLLIGGGWPGALDAGGVPQVLRESLEGNLALAARALPALSGVAVLRAWAGVAVHLDRGPVIGTTPGQPGLWHAVTSNGYTLGPLAGRMVADAIAGRQGLPREFAP